MTHRQNRQIMFLRRVEWIDKHVPLVRPQIDVKELVKRLKAARLLSPSTYWVDFHWSTYRNAVSMLRRARKAAKR